MVERSGAVNAHVGHDLEAVAAHAIDDVSAAATVGAGLAGSCSDCAALVADIRAITTATSSLRSVAVAAPRDFRLTDADARRLSPRGWLTRLTSRSGRTGTRRLQGLGGAVAALGLAGLAFAAVGPAGSIQAAAETFTQTREDPAAGDTSYEPAPAIGPVASENVAILDDGSSKAATTPEAGEARMALGVVSGAAVVAGVGLALLGRTRRRTT